MYNKNFRLDIDDIYVIEKAIDFRISALTIRSIDNSDK